MFGLLQLPVAGQLDANGVERLLFYSNNNLLLRDLDIHQHTMVQQVFDAHPGAGGGQARLDGQSVEGGGIESHESIDHDGRQERAFIEFAIDAQAAGRAATL